MILNIMLMHCKVSQMRFLRFSKLVLFLYFCSYRNYIKLVLSDYFLNRQTKTDVHDFYQKTTTYRQPN